MTGIAYPEESIGERLREGAVRPLDLSGRERQLRSAMTAMERISQSFSRYARRSMPFLTRQHARLVPGSVQVGTSPDIEPFEPPLFSIHVGPSDSAVRGAIVLNSFAVGITLEGALGGSSNNTPHIPTGDVSPAQRALLGRVGRSLAVDLCNAIQEEVGLAWLPLGPEVTAQQPVGGVDALQVVCVIEGPQIPARIMLVASAEALESAARDQVDAGGTQSDPRLTEALREVPLELVAELGRVKMGLRRVLSFAVGDVVRLKTAVDDTISVRVGGIEKFQAMPVLSRGQLAIEIRNRRSR